MERETDNISGKKRKTQKEKKLKEKKKVNLNGIQPWWLEGRAVV